MEVANLAAVIIVRVFGYLAPCTLMVLKSVHNNLALKTKELKFSNGMDWLVLVFLSLSLL